MNGFKIENDRLLCESCDGEAVYEEDVPRMMRVKRIADGVVCIDTNSEEIIYEAGINPKIRCQTCGAELSLLEGGLSSHVTGLDGPIEIDFD